MGCDLLLKGTKVDGVYDSDPARNPEAKRYDTLGYMQVLTQDLGVMDHAAISLARENAIPILVFSIYRPGAFAEVLSGNGCFTLVQNEGRSEEHTSELQSLMRISYAVFCLKKHNTHQ